MATYTLELLHFTDQEANAATIDNIDNLSAVLNALRDEDLFDDGVADNTLTLSSGDAIIPGLFFDASEVVFGSQGIADIAIQNELGVEAIALGNHEFDLGTGLLAGLIDGSATGEVFEVDYAGTEFPYLSANLGFETDPNLAGLEVEGGQAPQGNTVTSSVVIEEGGELIGVVGATVPTIRSISSAGDDIGIFPDWASGSPTDAELTALADILQAEVDALLTANPDMNKVILLSHMQQISIELALAEQLSGVDIIVAGGSNTRLFDDEDRIRDGDSDQGQYPLEVTNADGGTTLVVNTDGTYKYVGRLVIDFDENGEIIADSYDETISGAFATDDQGVADLSAAGLVDPEVDAITDAIQDQIVATESNVFGVSDVFLNGNRSGTFASDDPDGVRTQETNLGNLTADANLAYANEIIEAQGLGDPVVISIKNGGGIRANIGQIVVPAGGDEAVRVPNEQILDGDGDVVKPEGGISQNDIATVLAFNNGLTLLDITKTELKAFLEGSVGALPDGVSGGFPQISGVQFSFDETQTAQTYDVDGNIVTAGERVQNAGVFDQDGNLIAEIVRDGEIVGDPNETYRIVTLDFLANAGDEILSTLSNPNRVDLIDLDADGVDDEAFTGVGTFAADGTEQDALAEYLNDTFPDSDNAFSQTDFGPEADLRIQNLTFRGDTVFAGVGTDTLEIAEIVRFDSDLEDPEGVAEIVKHEDGVLYVTNGAEDAVDLLGVLSGEKITSIDLTTIDGFDGVNSLDVKDGLLAVAIEGEGVANGQVAFFDVTGETPALLNSVEVGNLPDMVTFTPDGSKLLVANEGEPVSATENPEGSVSIIDLSGGAEAATVQEVSFAGFNGTEDDLRADGIRIFPGFTAAQDFEPEFIAVSPDGAIAYVTLQENNALAIIDVESGEITDLVSQGTVDFSEAGNEADVSNRDGGINIQNWPAQGFRMADGMDSFEIDGQTYLITANEGDAREYTVEEEGEAFEGGEILDLARGADLTLDETAFPDAAELQLDENLGRLEVSTIDGDTDNDGDVDEIFAFGGRSVSIYDVEGNLVSDTGALFANVAAQLNADEFQANDGDFDGRSDDAGVEPESVVVGEIGGRTFAFVGLERDSGIVVLDISNPASPELVQYFNGSDTSGDVSPEGLQFVSAEDSPTGEPVLVASYEVSGTTVVYSLSDGDGVIIGGATSGDDTLLGGAFRDVVGAGGGDDSLRLGDGDDVASGGAGNDDVRMGAGDDIAAGGAGDDTLIGAAGNDILRGGDGADTAFGGAGDDILRGGAGDDALFGNSGDDILDGGAGDDTLNGGIGDDRMTGGDGADTFEFAGAFGRDIVRDFEQGVDKLEIDAAASFEELTIFQNGDNAVIRIDADRAVVLKDVDSATLTEDDFIF